VKAIDGVCKSENGFWGGMEHNIFGCFLPEKDCESSLKIAKRIQTELSEKSDQTLSIGIACYPFIEYAKSQILINAKKALDHAGFFGPSSVVVFDAVSLNISGDNFYHHGDIHSAIAEFETALKIDPENVNVLNSLGVCYADLGDFEKALLQFEKAINISPEEVMAWYNTGLTYKLMKNNEKALQFFLKAEDLDGKIFEVAFQTGKIYFELGNPKEGKKYYQKAIDLESDNGPNYRFLGECYAGLDLIDEAIGAYKNAVKVNPNDAHSLSALGNLFDKKGENPEIAMVFCRQSIEISPENGLFRNRLGSLYLKQNRLDEAILEFEKANELGFDSSLEIQKTKSLMQEQNKN
jgi:tetratricopeptide (TPR) repeat protein